tara:strand:+ start:4742 stop:5035 length:294 start_codon:yes stop_codon:yes gene_type:complete
MRVDPDNLMVYAEKEVIKYSAAPVSELLGSGYDPEEFFDDAGHWDDEDEQSFKWHIEVDGVVSNKHHRDVCDGLKDRIAKLEKMYLELKKSMESEEE